MAEEQAQKLLKTLREAFKIPKRLTSTKNPFETLIATIISQNTADRNTVKAFENLSKQLRITPEALANTETSHIEECLKPAGLYRKKARTIKNVSKILLSKYNGSLKSILSMPLEEARAALRQFPGVGPKTADVVLLFSANKPTIPVDTHVNRVSKRLGLAPSRADYEIVRKSLQSLCDPKDYLAIHVALILLGRKYCRARTSLCKQCPLNSLCPSNTTARHEHDQTT